MSQLQKSKKNLDNVEDRRFIEDTFPLKEVSEESAKEKSIRHGHISTLHIWWARRPLASSRATNFAALIASPTDPEDSQRMKIFIASLCRWRNSLDSKLLEQARIAIREANGGTPPRVLDPYAGGGSVPLEALRLGCETHASDYNPVAMLILKCTLEYPAKYHNRHDSTKLGLAPDHEQNRLLSDVRKWGDWVLSECKKQIGRFYPMEDDGSVPVGYVWARTIACQNPSCNAEIPLMRRFWLARKDTKKIALYPQSTGKELKFKIVGTGYERMPGGFDPNKGTVSRAIANCLVCGTVIDGNTTRGLFLRGLSGERLIAVISHKRGSPGKRYRISTDNDEKIFNSVQAKFQEKRNFLMGRWGFDPVPDEEFPRDVKMITEPLGSAQNYHFSTWGDVFNVRQKLAMITFAEKVREVYQNVLKDSEPQHALIVSTYLGVILNRLADKISSLVIYNVVREEVEHVFGRQVLQMTWDYVELNPFTDVGWLNMQEWVELVIDHLCQIPLPETPARVTQSSAVSLAYPDNYFDAVFTDPPYYDNVPYSHLSDFFYVWFKRTIGHIYPELFSTPLTPKAEEIVAYSRVENGVEKGKEFFENRLGKSFLEINRVLKPNGISVIVYAHKSTAAWETLINSLLDSGLVVTGAWPLHTEIRSGLRVAEKAILASSIYMIARKLKREPVGFYKDVRDSLRSYLNVRLDKLWEDGISGADFFIAAIGSSLEVFGKYDKVIDDEGSTVRANRFLENIRRIVTDYAVKQVLHNGFTEEITPKTRFYVLWRWAYGEARLEFDDAHKLAQGVGIALDQEWNRGFIRKEGEFINVLGPEDRQLEKLESSNELIDTLHHVLLLWKEGNGSEVLTLLRDTGFGKSEVFYRVAQAIAESLSGNSKEKKLLEGFLQGRERIAEDIRRESDQRKLFE